LRKNYASSEQKKGRYVIFRRPLCTNDKKSLLVVILTLSLKINVSKKEITLRSNDEIKLELHLRLVTFSLLLFH